MKPYHEKIIDEILQIIKDNLILIYNYDDNSLINLRKYCIKNAHKRYKLLSYLNLINFTEEAITEIVNTPYLYDFRELE